MFNIGSTDIKGKECLPSVLLNLKKKKYVKFYDLSLSGTYD